MIVRWFVLLAVLFSALFPALILAQTDLQAIHGWQMQDSAKVTGAGETISMTKF
jgi:hypothetical protein